METLNVLLFSNKQEVRKQRSGRSLNEDSRDESADKKRGMFFSWSRNRSFGKGPKKKEIGDINLGEKLMNERLQFYHFCSTESFKVLVCPRTRHQITASSRVAMRYMWGRHVETQLPCSDQRITHTQNW